MTIEIGDSALLDTWAATGVATPPNAAKIGAGWQNSERPPFQFLNWLFQRAEKSINHVLRNGVPVWNATTNYAQDDLTKANGVLYRVINANLNDPPPSVNWARVLGGEKASAVATDIAMSGFRFVKSIAANVASATIINLAQTALPGQISTITGNVQIESFSNGLPGTEYVFRVAAPLILKHDATKFFCLSGQSIATEANDIFGIIIADGSSNVFMTFYSRASGKSVVPINGEIPIGGVVDYPGIALPTNYLWCDAASYLRTDYPLLFTAIQTRHGAPDGTHFRVPDRRGVFVRGSDKGAGRSPDIATRSALWPGGATGDVPGSYEADALIRHKHMLYTEILFAGTGGFVGVADDDHAGTQNAENPALGTDYFGGSETRGKNVLTDYIIRYR